MQSHDDIDRATPAQIAAYLMSWGCVASPAESLDDLRRLAHLVHEQEGPGIGPEKPHEPIKKRRR